MRRVTEQDDPIGDAILLGVGVVVIHPLRAGPRTVPLVGLRNLLRQGSDQGQCYTG